MPDGIATGPDGNLWFTETRRQQDRPDHPTTGAVTEFAVRTAWQRPRRGSRPAPTATSGSPSQRGNKIGRITRPPASSPSSPSPRPASVPDEITAGPDGNLWFTESTRQQDRPDHHGRRHHRVRPAHDRQRAPGDHGRARTAPLVHRDRRQQDRPDHHRRRRHRFADPRRQRPAVGITAGPDGNLWFTETAGNRIGRLDPPLSAAGEAANPTEGVPFSGVVATFTDPDPGTAPADYAATIVWGDGIFTAGQVARDATGGFTVAGNHSYARGGRSYAISVAIVDDAGSTAIVSATAAVAQAPLSAAAAPLAAVEGVAVPAGTMLASFTDTGGPDPISAYSATVAWGDGTTGAATVQQNGANFRVVSAAAHTYAEEGSYTPLVTITEKNSAGAVINTDYAAGAASVADAALTSVAVPALAAAKGTALLGVTVASFTDANAKASSGDFAATIDWGDGTPPSLGTVSQPGGVGTAFVIKGSHTYAVDRATAYPITVAIRDRGGSTLTATSQATIADAAPLASGIPVRMTKALFFAAPVAYIVEVPARRPSRSSTTRPRSTGATGRRPRPGRSRRSRAAPGSWGATPTPAPVRTRSR